MGKTLLKKQSTKVVILDNNKVLIMRLEPVERKLRGIDEWHLPGGSIEDNEGTPEVAAIREVKEETGLDVEVVRELGHESWDAYYRGDTSTDHFEKAHFEAIFFEGRLKPNQNSTDIKIDGKEHEEAAWIGVDGLAKYPDLTSESKKYIEIVLKNTVEGNDG